MNAIFFRHCSFQTVQPNQPASPHAFASQWIGKGGGMDLYLAQYCGANVIGITLSKEQLVVTQRRMQACALPICVAFRLQDYRYLSKTFDPIVSVGMFEHVGLGGHFYGAAQRGQSAL